MKNPLKSKTIWFSVLVALAGVAAYLEQIPSEHLGTYGLIVVGCLSAFLRSITSEPITKPLKRDSKGRFTAGSIVLMMLLMGCATLSVSAKNSADCKFKVQAPHSIICTVDGKQVYEQSGPMALDIKGCCKCQTTED
jgi:hypothetical protein